MGKILAVHSFKGGTGKSFISVNLAATFARRGKSVCLLDLDLRAPSLGITFKKSDGKHFTNDFLDGDCEIDDVVINMTRKYATKGKFLVGLANHSTEAMREVMTKDRRWEMKSLHRLLSLRNTLVKDRGIDYVLLDTSPGVEYSSINAVTSSDGVLVVSILDESDIEGTRGIIQSIYELLEKKVFVVMNRVPIELISSGKTERDNLLEKVTATLGIPVLELIPCYCDILQFERASIFVIEKPNHPFTKILDEFSGQLAQSL